MYNTEEQINHNQTPTSLILIVYMIWDESLKPHTYTITQYNFPNMTLTNPTAKHSISNANPVIWTVWKAANKLEERKDDFYPSITPRVVSILRHWGSKWDGLQKWRSLLDKRSLLHEIEESIVAIHHLLQGTSSIQQEHIVVDACGGKGIFSFLLSYLKPSNVNQIVLLEKAEIDWYHIHEANETALEEGRPKIVIWSNTNLHEYDKVLDRLLDLPLPVAMSGIHLCKQLSPSFCGLVNGLGKTNCIYACLAPCCLPTAVTSQKHKKKPNRQFTIPIPMEESKEERESRRDYMERRERIKRKPIGGPCFLCHDEDHGLRECPVLPTLPKEERISIRRAWHAATIPCWQCLQFGHYKNECPVATTSCHPRSMQPPMFTMDVSNVLQEKKPFSAYCHLLAESLQDRRFRVVETELDNMGNHQEGNWNSERKSIFIVAA